MPFQKGKSGNPGGRPKENAEVRDLARQHTKEAVTRLVSWMRSDNAKASVSAANAILDRGWGKSTQPVDGSLESNLTIQVIERFSGHDPE